MAYNISEIGRPVSLVLTTPSTTINEITDWDYEDGKSVEYKSAGNSTYDRHHLTKFGEMLTIKTTDVSLAFGNLKKGATVAGLTFKAEAPYVGDAGGTSNSIGLQHTQFFKVTMSYAVIEVSQKISGNAEGGPAEYELKFKAVRMPDGTAPTVTAALAGS